jgi:DNA-binding MarR family transcriptional regulator
MAARAHRALLQERVDALGLHLGQELLLVELAEHPGSTQAEVVGRIGVEQPTIAKSIARLERGGLVLRLGDERDRRVTRLRLTAEGARLVDRIVGAWADADRAAARSLSAGEQRTLIKLLGKLAAGAAAMERPA